ncbi:hypothetical protein [Levilactobacillus bambusae]|uniref:Uncharacterized protein n=1 Tax=Levilactobacillus bambusae TaxID=2024736 RepID=A0A2V1N1U2_9LACO|nr:hypothetical protein [Levilactobacillus bambusae]PWG00963.1 hypothetical protein DCM90_01950 [Levilactobacillus bambusae]
MGTYIISKADYDLIMKLGKTIFVWHMKAEQNGDQVKLTFANYDELDEFMAHVDELEATKGMDAEQENLTMTGIRLQKLYDGAMEVELDE